MGLLTSTVGSFPKPPELARARRAFADGDIGRLALEQAERSAVRETIALQESLGLDLVVDGEMERGDMTTFFAERLEGMETSGLVRSYGNRYYRKPRIVGPVRRPGPLTVESWKFAQAASKQPVKAILTGPYTLMDWSFDEHYPSREACCIALAEVVRQEAEDLVAAGARDLQVDEPAISARPDELPLAVARPGNRHVGDPREGSHLDPPLLRRVRPRARRHLRAARGRASPRAVELGIRRPRRSPAAPDRQDPGSGRDRRAHAGRRDRRAGPRADREACSRSSPPNGSG